MLRKFLLAGLCAVSFGAAGLAQAATWQVLGGSVYVPPDPISGYSDFSGILSPGNPGVLIDGAYQNEGEIFADAYLTSPDPNSVWNYPMRFFTSETSIDTGQPTAPLFIDIANNVANLTSMNVSWYEIVFESMGAGAVPIAQNADGSYRMVWQMTGGFSSAGTATVTMDIAPVPVPAALWLLGSGVLSMLGIAVRSRRSR